MTFQQELNSWLSPKSLTTSPAPELNSKAPSTSKLTLPAADGKPTIITFLRHCGCPCKPPSTFQLQQLTASPQVAEKTLLSLRALASTQPSINFIAISHSSPSSTQKWTDSLGGADKVQVIVDEERDLYAEWGLGVSSAWHVLNPWSMFSVYTLGKKEGIWNKPTESGSRWQTSGSWAVDGEGFVRWGGVAKAADDVSDFGDAVMAVEGGQA